MVQCNIYKKGQSEFLKGFHYRIVHIWTETIWVHFGHAYDPHELKSPEGQQFSQFGKKCLKSGSTQQK